MNSKSENPGFFSLAMLRPLDWLLLSIPVSLCLRYVPSWKNDTLLFIVAVVGNAAEHSTAIMMALKNKMDLSLGIAVGSSLQIALFVTPSLLFASYLFGRPMTLEFSLPEVAAVALAVWIVSHISGDGECNWLEGVQLLAVYFIIGILFYFLRQRALAPRQKEIRASPGARQARRINNMDHQTFPWENCVHGPLASHYANIK